MFRFESPVYLYGLILIPILILIQVYVVVRQKRDMRKMGDSDIVKSLLPDYSEKRKVLKLSLLSLAITCTFLMMARPQFGTKVDSTQQQGIEIMFALDVSNSMQAQDVSPNRLNRAKSFISSVINKMKGNKVGLLIFAGDAFIQLPLTPDYVSAQMFLNAITPEMIRTQGTDISRALSMSSKGFSSKKDIGKAIVIITDGEEHEGGIDDAIRQTAKRHIHTFVIGVGSAEGATIPQDNDGSPMVDDEGNVIVTKLNESMCRTIAAKSDGLYIHLDGTSSAQKELEEALDKLIKGDMENPVYTHYNEQFQLIALLICLILFCDICITERKHLKSSHKIQTSKQK